MRCLRALRRTPKESWRVAFTRGNKGASVVEDRQVCRLDPKRIKGPVEIQLISPYKRNLSLLGWNRRGSEKVTNEVSREFRYEARSPRG